MLHDLDALGLETRRSRRATTRAYSWHVVDGLLRAADVLTIAVAGLIASYARFLSPVLNDLALAAILIGALLSINIFSALKLYDHRRLNQLSYQLARVLGGWALTIAGVLVALYMLKTAHELSRLWVVYWFTSGVVGFIVSRILVKRVVMAAQAAGQLMINTVVIGERDLLAGCAAHLDDPAVSSRVVAVIDIEDLQAPQAAQESCEDPLERVLKEQRVDRIVLALPMHMTEQIRDIILRTKAYTLEISLFPALAISEIPILHISRVGDAPLVVLAKKPLEGWQAVIKTVEDRILASLILLFIAPLFALIALSIRLTSRGPVFYIQHRAGFDQEPIKVFKFRTMYHEACDYGPASQIKQATRDDPRVTPLGRILRRTSLDELPQLINVLRGEMSIVGPRPHALAHNSYYSNLIDDYLSRHRVKPGITGWAQVNGYRGEVKTTEQMVRRLEMDIHYIENWSLWFDLRILMKTLFTGFLNQNAY